MHRNKLIVAMLATVSAMSTSAQAQPEGEVYELLTTAIHNKRSETALPVTVLSGDELHSVSRATLGETLAGQPGISNASFGPAVGQTVIRGQQGRRVLSLTNAMPNADASGNSADHAQTTEAILARSIEVLRGPSTLLYGGGAIGGVVNVIDNRIAGSLPDRPAFAFETRHDSAGDTSTVVAATDFSTANLAWHLDTMQREWNNLDIPGYALDERYTDDDHQEEAAQQAGETHEAEYLPGFISNTGGRTRNSTAGVSWIMDNGYLGLAVSRLDNDYGLPPGTHAHEGEETAAEEAEGMDFVSIDMQRTRYDLSGEWQDLAPWAETLSYRLSHTDYSHQEVESNGETGTRFSNDSWQHRLQLTHTDTEQRHGVIGLQLSRETFAALGEESFIPVTDISADGLFWIEDFHSNSLTTEFGARFNRDSYRPLDQAAGDRDFSTWSFSASGLWDISPAATAGISVSRSQRPPSVEELYSNFALSGIQDCIIHFASSACEIGDNNFKSETSLNTDLTLYLEQGRLSATLTVFYNRFSDYIGQVSTATEVNGFPVREYRQDDARFHGIEVDMNYEINPQFALRLFGDSMRGSFDHYGDIPRMPARRIGLGLNMQLDAFSASATLTHASRQDRPGSSEIATDSWTRLDLSADYTLENRLKGELLLFLRARNLLDEEIRLSTSYLRGFAPEAGRSLEAGIRYQY